jgi:hypothetical protein
MVLKNEGASWEESPSTSPIRPSVPPLSTVHLYKIYKLEDSGQCESSPRTLNSQVFKTASTK